MPKKEITEKSFFKSLIFQSKCCLSIWKKTFYFKTNTRKTFTFLCKNFLFYSNQSPLKNYQFLNWSTKINTKRYHWGRCSVKELYPQQIVSECVHKSYNTAFSSWFLRKWKKLSNPIHRIAFWNSSYILTYILLLRLHQNIKP